MFTDHVSHSSLNLYKRCPAAFKFHYTKPGSPPSDNMIEGQKNHEKIAQALKAGDSGSLPLGPRLKTFCKNILGDPIKFIEQRFSIDFLRLKIEGIVDAANIFDDTAVICDWKNSPSSFVNEYQLRLYGLFIISAFPRVETVHGFFGYIKNDYWDSFCYFKPDLKNFEIELSNLIDEILADDKFTPRPGSFCQSCRHVEICPAAGEFILANPKTVKQAVELAERAVALEALVDKTKEYVKNFMLENSIESIPIGDSRYYISSSPTMRQGRFKTQQDKTACQKSLELITNGTRSKPDTFVAAKETIDSTNEKKPAEFTANVLSTPDIKNEKIRMVDLTELIKKAGILPLNASSLDAGAVIRKRLGTNFITATDSEKAKLKADLEAEIKRIEGIK